jgi:pyruvate/2-oxoglutarate dehydrogenase complex dihydrolipoamide dehydrogenase (E3) component
VLLKETIERVAPGETGDIQVWLRAGELRCDGLLVSSGRRPNVAGLDLDRAGVVATARGIVVDDQLRTSTPHIYACGDVTGSFQFTHYAAWQAFIAVRNALLPGSSRGIKETTPWTIFTDPEIAQVGLDEAAARRQHGDAVEVTVWPMARVDRAVTEGELEGFIKIIHRADGTLLGASIACRRAGDLAQEFAVGLNAGLKVNQLASAIHVYPTYGFGVQQALAEAVVGRLGAGASGAVITRLAQGWPFG